MICSCPGDYQVGTSLGARRGLLIRGGDILEKVSSVDTIVFDKTGTLTVGRPVVKSVICSGLSERDLLTLAAGVERTASHPVARALVQAASNAGCRQAAVCVPLLSQCHIAILGLKHSTIQF